VIIITEGINENELHSIRSINENVSFNTFKKSI